MNKIKKGCLITLGIFVLLLISSMGYCGYAAYRASSDLPYINALTNNYITYYNRNNIDELYKISSSEYTAKFTKEQYLENINKLKKFADQVEVMDQLGWRSQTNNLSQYLIVQYNGRTQTDKLLITMTFIKEDTWKVYGFHFELK